MAGNMYKRIDQTESFGEEPTAIYLSEDYKLNLLIKAAQEEEREAYEYFVKTGVIRYHHKTKETQRA